jgi:nucleotide-binding universal stress UspA family protein
MYKRLLVPLDGSRLAESILPAAAYLAKSVSAAVVLIHVIEKDAPQEVHGDQHLRDVAEAEIYLSRVAGLWFIGVASVETHVHSGEVADVARSLLQHVREFSSDLTLMCTHGRTGARQFLYGSIAQQIAAAGVPVLFIHGSIGGSRSGFVLQKLLVPLDGDPEHEKSLAIAVELACVTKAAIHLLTVVPSLGLVSGSWTQSVRLLPSTTDRMLDMEAGEAEKYLHRHRLKLEGIPIAATCEVVRGDPTEEIIKVAEASGASLMVLGTHGTIGTQAFWSGGVAARVARKTVAPVLLVPAASGLDRDS